MVHLHQSGRNALDFVIACGAGQLAYQYPQSALAILSYDKGYDPMIDYLVRRGQRIRRIERLSTVVGSCTKMRPPAQCPRATTRQAAARLRAMPHPPRTRRHLRHWLINPGRVVTRLSEADQVIAELERRRFVQPLKYGHIRYNKRRCRA